MSAAPPAPQAAHEPGTARKHRPFQVQKLGKAYANEAGTTRDDLSKDLQGTLHVIAGYWRGLQILLAAAPEPEPGSVAAVPNVPAPVAPSAPSAPITSAASSSGPAPGGAQTPYRMLDQENAPSNENGDGGDLGGTTLYTLSEDDAGNESAENESPENENADDGGGEAATSAARPSTHSPRTTTAQGRERERRERERD